MQHLLSFIGSWIPGHQLRPLLIGAGAAVVAAGVFHFERKRRLVSTYGLYKHLYLYCNISAR